MTDQLPRSTKEIIVDITVQLNELQRLEKLADSSKKANIEIKGLKEEINRLKSELMTAEKESKDYTDALLKKSKAVRKTNDELRSLANRIGSKYTPAVKESNKAVNSAAKGVDSWAGKLASLVQRFIVFTLIVQSFRAVVNEIRELISLGEELATKDFTFQLGVRVAQGQGLDVTFQEVSDFIDKLDELTAGISRSDLESSIARTFAPLSKLGLQKQEILDSTEAIVLASQAGADFEKTLEALVTAITTGRFDPLRDSLADAGIIISDAEVRAEALSKGLIEQGDVLSDEAEAVATLSVTLRKFGAIQEEVGGFAETTAGKIAEQNEGFQDLRESIADTFTRLRVAASPFIDTLIKNLEILIPIIERLTKEAVGGLIIAFSILDRVVAETLKGQITSFEDLKNIVAETGASVKKELEEILFSEELPTDAEIGVPVPDVSTDDLEEELQDVRSKVADIFRKFFFDLNEAAIDLANKLEDIDIKTDRARFDNLLRYNRAVAKENRKAIDERAEAEQEYREEELKAEEDYQDKLRKLREKFLFDLEDALRERDARQVLRLIRKFNLDKNNLQKESELEAEQRKRDFENELRDLEAQRQARLRELRIEFEQRNADITTQREREIADAERWHQRRVAQLIRQRDEKLAILRASLDAEYQMVFDAELRKQAFLSQLAAQARSLIGSFGGYNNLLPIQNEQRRDPYYAGGFAKGGSFIASRPTTALFGEGTEPELVTAIPLSRLSSGVPVAGGSSSSGGGGGGMVNVGIALSPGLVGEIVEKTENSLANVYLELGQ